MVHNKKNKRGSIITSSPLMTTKTELIERTPENDYGVLSDPEEGVEINEKTDIEGLQRQSRILNDSAAAAAAAAEPHSSDNETRSPQPKQSSPQQNMPLTQSLKQPPSPSSSQLSSQQAQSQPPPPSPLLSQSTLTLSGRLTPSLPPPSPGTKSLQALQLKLTTDKNYSKKITLHTFFSYIVLAIEIVRASSASIARISIDNVEKLVEYMIFHHTANKDIEAYLTTLLKTDVIRNLITAVVEFNTDQADALDKLLSAEQMEMEMLALKDAADAAAATAAAPRTHDDKSCASTPPEGHVAQTSQPQSKGPNRFLRFLKCLFCGCCHRRRESDKRRDSSIILDEIEPSTTVKQSEEVMPDDVPRVVVVVVVDESQAEVDTPSPIPTPLPESDSLPPNTGNA